MHPHRNWAESNLASATQANDNQQQAISQRLAERRQQLRQDNASTQTSSVFQQLSREVRKLETASRVASEKVLSSGCAALDACLPQQGYVPGSVVEYLRATPACGASYLAFAAAASAMQATGGFVVVIDTQHQIYPPALAAHGIDLQKVVFVRPQSAADALWATDQALRTPAVAAVVAELEKIDDRAARRLQLAAEKGDGLGLLLRSAATRLQPSWSEVQWLLRCINPTAEGAGRGDGQLGRQLQVKLVRNRGGKAGASLRLEIDSLSGTIKLATIKSATIKSATLRERNRHEPQAPLRLASELASPTSPSRRAAAS